MHAKLVFFFQSLSTTQNNKWGCFFFVFVLEPFLHLKALFWGARSQFLHSATVIFTIFLARARFLSPRLAPHPTFNLLQSSKVCYKGSPPPCLTSDEFLWLSFRPTSLPTCPGGAGGAHIWWDCSCLILLSSLWSVINFLLSPSLPVCPALSFPIAYLNPPPKLFFYYFFFIESDSRSLPRRLHPLLFPFLPSSLALIFSPACIQRKRRRSHSSTHDWPQPVS